MSDTKIEWADKSWSPITGCSPVSEGCTNCYARRMAKRLAGRFGYPKDEPFRVTFHSDKLLEPLKWRKPRRIFVCSMGDLFHDEVEEDWIDEIFQTIAENIHTFLILTKRPNRMKTYCDWYVRNEIELPENLWPGVSVENQKRADERIPILLQIPAKVRFISIEPMLERMDLRDYLNGMPEPRGGGTHYITKDMASDACMPEIEGMRVDEEPEWIQTVEPLNWVILGGETGPGARPMHPDWVRSVRDQCQEAGVPFFFKNMGSAHEPQLEGKITAGRLLDGKIWEEWPE